jgi:hypothetical protein
MLNMSKLKPYYTSHEGSSAAPASSRNNAWTDDILGVDDFTMSTGSQPLEVEVDSYLLDRQHATSSLMYWQVQVTVFVFAVPLTISIRRINSASQHSSNLQWTYFQSRGLQSPVNEFSHQRKKPPLYVGTESNQNLWRHSKCSNFLF